MSKTLTLDKLVQVTPEKYLACKGKTFVGIDFGTSTTVVSIASLVDDGSGIKCETAQLRQQMKDGALVESDLMPTVIAVKPDNVEGLLVGKGAYDLRFAPDYSFGINLWDGFKMELGKDLGPRWFGSKQWRIKSPQEATKVFFAYLKRQIEWFVKQNGYPTDIHYAVSIPASFESNQRKDLLDALTANGIAVEGQNLIDEPNAAFLGYIHQDYTVKDPIRLRDGYDPKVLVFDFGAGTCDISILALSADYKGINTRNISISQFEELGGMDIDRYIAVKFLLPEILKKNGRDKEPYTDAQKDCIVKQLLGVAERLKIQVCKALDFYIEEKELLDEAVKKGDGISIKSTVDIYTEYGNLRQEEFKLKFKDFMDTMKDFYGPSGFWWSFLKNRKHQGTIKNVVSSAIAKAQIDKGEIDYVMMVGGSSKNPYVKAQLKKEFGKGTEFLLPQDMQNLVSQGAAIHSLLVHGLGITAIKPIVSEPVVVVTADEVEAIVVPAGKQIPFAPITFNQISTGDRDMTLIEVPICVGSGKKLVHNIKLKSTDGKPFPRHSRITLTFEMTADKVLRVKAQCQDVVCEAQAENPFENTYLTDAESKILEAQRASNVSASENGGKPTREALRALRQAYIDADKEYQAAETLVDELSYYPQSDMYNYLGVLYHNGGDYTKAIHYLRKAVKENPRNSSALSNLGHDLKITGEFREAKECLTKASEIKADYAMPLITLGEILRSEGDKEEAQKVWERGYNILKQRWDDGNLDNCSCGWLISVANSLDKYDVAAEVRKGRPSKPKNSGYNRDNLASHEAVTDDLP